MEWVRDWLWQWILPIGLLVTAVRCGFAQKWMPLRDFRRTIRDTLGSLSAKQTAEDRKESPSQRQIVATALAAAMGTGNLIGTAAAIAAGGAGAIFWMWVSALAGMLLVYAENVLGIRFRRKTADGWRGGAIACLRYGLHMPLTAWIFAVCCAAAGLGMGSMAQANAIAAAAKELSVPPPAAGVVTVLLGGWILCGGTKKIGRVTAWLMPLLCGIYMLGCGWLLVCHAERLPAAFARIFREAFGFRGMAGGFCASVLMQSLRVGICRGIFSNEAGLGSSALLHMETAECVPDRQGRWAATEVFLDTIVCCTLTALVVLTASVPTEGADGASLLLAAFAESFGTFAADYLAVMLILFAFATFIGWYPCGLAAARYGLRGGAEIYLPLYLLIGFVGALGGAERILMLCDCLNACMAIPNLLGLWLLRGELAAETERMQKNENTER
ncbi:MAG: amino acid carrier protein [Oscillospiraceae bacterium]|nr:amino acid carrier protein [Oscillospiraceae bacterium]